MMRKILVAAMAALALSATLASAGRAASFVVSGYATSSGGAAFASMFGNSDGPYRTTQIGYSAATLAQQVGGLPVGALITGIGFRIARGQATFTGDLSFDQFDISIGTSSAATGSLGTNFNANLGDDTLVARSGALTIAGGSFVKGSTSQRPGAFYTINLDTPYAYSGGDLLVTMATHLTSQLAANSFYLDAFSTVPYNKVDFIASNETSAAPATGKAHFFYQPVMQLTYSLPSAVPEPASWAMMIVGFGLVGASLRGARRAGARSIRST